MGLEAACTVRVGRKTGSGKALLEGNALFFRGDIRLEIPFERVQAASVEGGTLIVRTKDHEARFELGATAAERWLKWIREPKGLLEKLEVSAQDRVAVVDIQDVQFLSALRERTSTIDEGRVPEGARIIFFGAASREALRKIPLLRARMSESGALWVIRPKGGRGVAEADVLDALRTSGLVDTKVVSFSRTHTAHKSVIPLELRGKAVPRPPILSLPPAGPLVPKKKGAPASSRSAAAKLPQSKKRR
jgi:hypothetical protein